MRRLRPSSVTSIVRPAPASADIASSWAWSASGGRSAVKRSIWIRSEPPRASSRAASAASIIGPGPQMKKAAMSSGSTRCSSTSLAFGAVEHAVEQVDILRFLGEEMVDLEPLHVAVLEPRELFEEDHRLAVAIAVEEGEAALRLLDHRGLDQRHDRRDPRAAGEGDIMVRRAGPKSQVKLPCGSITSSRSPGFSVSFAQLEKRPPAMRLTVTLSSPSSARRRANNCAAPPRRRSRRSGSGAGPA
jgi:hypothetical protein